MKLQIGSNLGLFTICFLVIILDQVSKAWIRSNIALEDSLAVFPGILEFKYTQNTGMAFSMLADQSFILTVLVVIINIFLITYILMNKVPLYFGFILGGALANLIDRFTLGFVTDFINPLFVDFAVFNIADVSLNVGVTLFILAQLKSMVVSK